MIYIIVFCSGMIIGSCITALAAISGKDRRNGE